MTHHPQDEATLDVIGFAARFDLPAVLLIIACIRFGSGG